MAEHKKRPAKKDDDRDQESPQSKSAEYQLRAQELLGDPLHGVLLGGLAAKDADAGTKFKKR